MEANANPYNLREEISKPYNLHFSGKTAEVEIGGNSFTCEDHGYGTAMAPISVDGLPLVGFIMADDHLLLNLVIFDEFNFPVLHIKNNQLLYSTDPWDIQLIGTKLTVREAHRKILIDSYQYYAESLEKWIKTGTTDDLFYIFYAKSRILYPLIIAVVHILIPIDISLLACGINLLFALANIYLIRRLLLIYEFTKDEVNLFTLFNILSYNFLNYWFNIITDMVGLFFFLLMIIFLELFLNKESRIKSRCVNKLLTLLSGEKRSSFLSLKSSSPSILWSLIFLNVKSSFLMLGKLLIIILISC